MKLIFPRTITLESNDKQDNDSCHRAISNMCAVLDVYIQFLSQTADSDKNIKLLYVTQHWLVLYQSQIAGSNKYWIILSFFQYWLVFYWSQTTDIGKYYCWPFSMFKDTWNI